MKKNEKRGGSRKGKNDFFTSLKLTISLLILLAFVSIIGTLIPQNLTENEYLRYYSESTYNALKMIGFFDLYHSWWFILLLFSLCINLLACSIKNVPRTLKLLAQNSPRLMDDQIENLFLKAKIEKNFSFAEAREKIASILKKNFCFPQETLEKGTAHLFCERARFSRWGFFITHISVVVILIGGLIGSLWGFKGNVEITEGTSTNQIRLQNGLIFDLGFWVGCDDFEVTYYPNGTPKDYKSSLSIFVEGKKVLTKIIEVNHPLKYKGLVFYQKSFGEAPEQGVEVILRVIKRRSEGFGNEFRVSVGESFILPKTDLKVKLNRFFPDFGLGENGVVINRSSALHNPALELLIFKGEELQMRTWAFQKFPDFHGNKGEYQFLIQDIKGKIYTGLQVTKDPGVNVVWIGCAMMIIGILITFFFSHQQVWVRIQGVGDKLELVVAGTARKNRIAFEKVFDKITRDIEKTI